MLVRSTSNFQPKVDFVYPLGRRIRFENDYVLRLYHEHDKGYCRSQWPLGLRHKSAVARLLRSWVWIPPGAWMFVCCECCVLSGRGLCDELITCPEEFYRLWCVIVCDLETSRMSRPWPALCHSATAKKKMRGIGLTLTLILLTWRIWWAPNNASKWQIGFNWVFEGLKELN